MWIATINERPDEQCVQDTAVEAVREALTWYNEQEAAYDNGECALTLEVCRYEQVDLPSIGDKVPGLIIKAWDNNAPEGAPALMFLDAAREELVRRVDALVRQWSDECGTRPDWYEQAGRAVLTLELAWGEDEDGPLAVITDEQWAQIEALDASPNWVEMFGTCADSEADPSPSTPERALEALRLAHPQQGWALVSGSILGSVRPFGASIVVTREEGEESEGWTVAISWAGETVGAQDADPVAAYRAALAKREARDAA